MTAALRTDSKSVSSIDVTARFVTVSKSAKVWSSGCGIARLMCSVDARIDVGDTKQSREVAAIELLAS